MVPTSFHKPYSDAAPWKTNGDSDLSVLCWLEPRNKHAQEVVTFNRHKASRVVTLYTEHGVAVDMLQIRFEEPKQQRGLVMFGRGWYCSIQFPHLKVSMDHCYLDLNPLSGVLMVHNTSKNGKTWVDGEQVVDPPYRAMILNHSQVLRVRDASFKIRWPNITKVDLPRYRSRAMSLADQLRLDPEVIDLTDNEDDVVSADALASVTRPASRQGPPLNGQSHAKEQELGRGAYGVVWRAVEKVNGNLIAVKQLQRTRDNMKFMEREIKKMRKLQHANIVQLLNWRQLDDHVELDLEYCRLGSLSSMMNPDSKLNLRLMFKHIARGLEHLHALGLIHRDIKPDNILVQESDGNVCYKLADFGFSNSIDQAFTCCGSPLYMAPEVNMREWQTSRLDIYSLGVVILEVLGCFRNTRDPLRLPRDGWQPILWETAINFHPGNHEADFCRKMISKDPSHRPTATQCLKFLNGKIVPPSGEEPHKDRRSRPLPSTDHENPQSRNAKGPTHDHGPPMPSPVGPRLKEATEFPIAIPTTIPKSGPTFTGGKFGRLPRGRFAPDTQRFGWGKNTPFTPRAETNKLRLTPYKRGFIRNLELMAGTQQDVFKLQPQLPGATPLERESRRQGLPADDLVQLTQALHIRQKHIASRDRSSRPKSILPGVLPNQAVKRSADEHPKVLQHQQIKYDGRVAKKRKLNQESVVRWMPGAWID